MGIMSWARLHMRPSGLDSGAPGAMCQPLALLAHTLSPSQRVLARIPAIASPAGNQFLNRLRSGSKMLPLPDQFRHH